MQPEIRGCTLPTESHFPNSGYSFIAQEESFMTPTGICFVSRSNWPEYCRISTDIPVGSDYDTFLHAVEKFCDDMAAKGGRAIKIEVKPADLLAWCQARRLQVNPSSRSHYAATRLIELGDQ
jgi:hypothetical protein